MPKQTFKPKKFDGLVSAVEEKPQLPREHFDGVSKKMIDALPELGEQVEVTIRGKLASKSVSEGFSSKGAEGSFSLEMQSMELYGSNEFEKMAKEDA
jgi:uncharacterized protein with von Willebrand factor type A (vWA) domain